MINKILWKCEDDINITIWSHYYRSQWWGKVVKDPKMVSDYSAYEITKEEAFEIML